MVREKEVSTRLMRPTLPEIDVDLLMRMVAEWDASWEVDGSIKIFDEGIAQYALTDVTSHHIFYASLCLGKASMRCALVAEEPADELDENAENTFSLKTSTKLSPEQQKRLATLKEILSRRGYQFADDSSA